MKQLNDIFPNATVPGTIEPFMHKGEWAIHNVLPILLDTFGQSDIRLTTFNVSEDSLRTLFFCIETDKIRSLKMLVDMTIKRHKLGLYLFAHNITPDIRIDSCLAKLLLIKNEQYQFGIVGSANLNHNHRWENGFYFTDGTHFDYFWNQFETAYQSSLPYDLG